MKLLLTTAAAALISTTAIASNSTYYSDLFFDTSINAGKVYSDGERAMNPNLSTRANDLMLNTANADQMDDTVLSSRGNLRSPGEGYIYGGYRAGSDNRQSKRSINHQGPAVPAVGLFIFITNLQSAIY